MKELDEQRLLDLATTIGESWNDELQNLRTISATGDLELSSLHDCMNSHLQRLAATNVWGSANRLASSRLWQRVSKELSHGSLQLRAREKPLGYAGDFGLLERICQGDVQGKGISALYDRYFQGHAAPQAVRNRADLLARQIVEHFQSTVTSNQAIDDYRVVSYGCGPAFELSLVCNQLSDEEKSHLSITLVDLDPAALKFAQSRMSEQLPSARITAIRANLSRLIRQSPTELPFPPANFIFAAGYFDYLALSDAADAIRMFWRRLRPTGKLSIFNFGEHNPSRAYMEWIANWYLIYRSESDMHQLAEQSNLPNDSWSVAMESAGVNRYITATKWG